MDQLSARANFYFLDTYHARFFKGNARNIKRNRLMPKNSSSVKKRSCVSDSRLCGTYEISEFKLHRYNFNSRKLSY